MWYSSYEIIFPNQLEQQHAVSEYHTVAVQVRVDKVINSVKKSNTIFLWYESTPFNSTHGQYHVECENHNIKMKLQNFYIYQKMFEIQSINKIVADIFVANQFDGTIEHTTLVAIVGTNAF